MIYVQDRCNATVTSLHLFSLQKKPGGGGDEKSAAVRLLRAVGQLTESARSVLAVVNEIIEFEEEIDRLLSDGKKPENACAG